MAYKTVPCKRGCRSLISVDADFEGEAQCGYCTQLVLNGITRVASEQEFDKCVLHPRYEGKGAPRSQCFHCWQIWRIVTGEEHEARAAARN